jgi:hypothetical protein
MQAYLVGDKRSGWVTARITRVYPIAAAFNNTPHLYAASDSIMWIDIFGMSGRSQAIDADGLGEG